MHPSTPYRFVEIWVPTDRKGRYTDPVHGWANVVAELLLPLKQALEARMPPQPQGQEMLFHCLQEGPWVQATWTAPMHWDGTSTRWPDYDVLRTVCKRKGFRIKRTLKGGTAGGGLNGTRWNPTVQLRSPASERRSCQLLRLMDSVFTLYSESLKPVYTIHGSKNRLAYWEVNAPECKRQNPYGNAFESAMHLIANATEARFSVYVTARTGWMHGGASTAVTTCHL